MDEITICHGTSKSTTSPSRFGSKKKKWDTIFDNKINVTSGQLLKLTPNLNTYLTTTNM
jgi:hypothetical protein